MNRNVITVKRAGRLIEWMAGDTMHAKRARSVTNAVVGVVNAVSLSIHAIGAGLAQATGRNAKHTIKQVDRLLSNSALRVWTLFAHWVPYVLASSRAMRGWLRDTAGQLAADYFLVQSPLRRTIGGIERTAPPGRPAGREGTSRAFSDTASRLPAAETETLTWDGHTAHEAYHWLLDAAVKVGCAVGCAVNSTAAHTSGGTRPV